MKKLAYVLLLFIGLTNVSCETCLTCTYQDFNTDEDITEEVCGNKDETNAFVKEYEDSAVSHRSEFQCIENY